MKKIRYLSYYLILSTLFLHIAACHIPLDCVDGKGPAVEHTLDLGSFERIRLKSSCTVYLKKGENQNVVIKGQQNLIDLLKTEVTDNTWDIKFEKCVDDPDDFEVHITLPSLSEASIYGSGDIKGNEESFSVKNLELNIYGSGDIKLSANVNKLSSSIRGSGDIELAGTAVKHDISIAGSGDIKASGLQCQEVNVEIRGSGDVRVHCGEKLNVEILGSGDVYYQGTPGSIEQDIKGSGEIKKLK